MLRKMNNGVLPSVLGVDGYNPSALSKEPTGASGSSPAAVVGAGAVTGSNATVGDSNINSAANSVNKTINSVSTATVPTTNNNAITAEVLDKMDQLILTISRYKVGHDGGHALKLLNTFINNICVNPTESKYYSINAESNAFKTKFNPLVGPVALLKLLGFKKSAMEEKYVLERY